MTNPTDEATGCAIQKGGERAPALIGAADGRALRTRQPRQHRRRHHRSQCPRCEPQTRRHLRVVEAPAIRFQSGRRRVREPAQKQRVADGGQWQPLEVNEHLQQVVGATAHARRRPHVEIDWLLRVATAIRRCPLDPAFRGDAQGGQGRVTTACVRTGAEQLDQVEGAPRQLYHQP